MSALDPIAATRDAATMSAGPAVMFHVKHYEPVPRVPHRIEGARIDQDRLHVRTCCSADTDPPQECENVVTPWRVAAPERLHSCNAESRDGVTIVRSPLMHPTSASTAGPATGCVSGGRAEVVTCQAAGPSVARARRTCARSLQAAARLRIWRGTTARPGARHRWSLSVPSFIGRSVGSGGVRSCFNLRVGRGG